MPSGSRPTARAPKRSGGRPVAAAAIALLALCATPAATQDRPTGVVLSAPQASLLLQIHTFVTVRVEPAVVPALPVAFPLQTQRLRALFEQQFNRYPFGYPEDRAARQGGQSYGRLVCRVSVAQGAGVAAAHVRCSLGNLYQNVIHAEQIRVVQPENLDAVIGAMIDDLFPSIAVRFFSVRRTPPDDWLVGDVEQGKRLATDQGCVACHAALCVSEPAATMLAGKEDIHLYNQLRRFRAGSRLHPPGLQPIAAFQDNDLRNLAEFYSRIDC